MTRKTEGLSYPSNPLAAIRELQELDAAPPGGRADNMAQDLAAEALATTLPAALPTSSATANATSSGGSSATSTRKRRPAANSKANAPKLEPNESGGALVNAVRDMLSQPYTADPKKGPYTVSTVKIPTEVSERLGWVAALTGRAKQEILTEALKDYFDKVLKEG
jgi:hypothetical protein